MHRRKNKESDNREQTQPLCNSLVNSDSIILQGVFYKSCVIVQFCVTICETEFLLLRYNAKVIFLVLVPVFIVLCLYSVVIVLV